MVTVTLGDCHQLEGARILPENPANSIEKVYRNAKRDPPPSSGGRIIEAHYKILKIARMISDLAGSEQIQSEHIAVPILINFNLLKLGPSRSTLQEMKYKTWAEAIQYRSLDRQWWS